MNLIIKTVQNDNPCIISFLFEFTKVLHISNFKIYSNLCVQHFHSIICRFSKMKFVIQHLETWGSTQPCVALWTAEFCTCFFVYGSTWHFMVTLNKPASVANLVECFWVSHACGLSSLYCSLWSRHPSRLLC